ncbi:MAG TPA: hypothetical protein VNT26_12700 [Candidatus Sulfotelmatobacter sp.]|nr:hypothetical protein [Candidatus Sulfotelmatobacter sp.]
MLELVKDRVTGPWSNLTSVLDYPTRDPKDKTYGHPGWWGNCSGLLIRDLIQFYQTTKFRSKSDLVVVDPMSGSGTTWDVCQDIGVACDAYDLNPAPRRGIGSFDVRSDELSRAADIQILHWPYGGMVVYSEDVWAGKAKLAGDPRDLSVIAKYEGWFPFLQAVNESNLRLFSDLKDGGLQIHIIGDWRSNGQYLSMMRDMAWLGDLEQILVKTQHNVRSGVAKYGGKPFIPIHHEYALVWRKKPGSRVTIRTTLVKDLDLTRWENTTWKALVRWALEQLGGKATLASLYAKLKDTKKAQANPTYDATIRRTLQECPDFVRCGEGVWKLAA